MYNRVANHGDMGIFSRPGGYHSGGRGALTRPLSVQKNEKITKNSTHSKIKLYIIFIEFFLAVVMLSVQKN